MFDGGFIWELIPLVVSEGSWPLLCADLEAGVEVVVGFDDLGLVVLVGGYEGKATLVISLEDVR